MKFTVDTFADFDPLGDGGGYIARITGLPGKTISAWGKTEWKAVRELGVALVGMADVEIDDQRREG